MEGVLYIDLTLVSICLKIYIKPKAPTHRGPSQVYTC